MMMNKDTSDQVSYRVYLEDSQQGLESLNHKTDHN